MPDSPGHNQNWIYSDVIELHKMAPTLRDAIGRHIIGNPGSLCVTRDIT